MCVCVLLTLLMLSELKWGGREENHKNNHFFVGDLNLAMVESGKERWVSQKVISLTHQSDSSGRGGKSVFMRVCETDFFSPKN